MCCFFSITNQARIQDFLKGGEGQGGPLRGGGGGVIAPVGEKVLLEHKKLSATRGVCDHPCTPPPGSATANIARRKH